MCGAHSGFALPHCQKEDTQDHGHTQAHQDYGIRQGHRGDF